MKTGQRFVRLSKHIKTIPSTMVAPRGSHTVNEVTTPLIKFLILIFCRTLRILCFSYSLHMQDGKHTNLFLRFDEPEVAH